MSAKHFSPHDGATMSKKQRQVAAKDRRDRKQRERGVSWQEEAAAREAQAG
jgi:hypothetical protein